MDVTLSYLDDMALLDIPDDGIGFTPGAVRAVARGEAPLSSSVAGHLLDKVRAPAGNTV
ncbi:MAG: hypothetical protein ACRDG4_01415 [Chloroflexota bacterium]